MATTKMTPKKKRQATSRHRALTAAELAKTKEVGNPRPSPVYMPRRDPGVRPVTTPRSPTKPAPRGLGTPPTAIPKPVKPAPRGLGTPPTAIPKPVQPAAPVRTIRGGTQTVIFRGNPNTVPTYDKAAKTTGEQGVDEVPRSYTGKIRAGWKTPEELGSPVRGTGRQVFKDAAMVASYDRYVQLYEKTMSPNAAKHRAYQQAIAEQRTVDREMARARSNEIHTADGVFTPERYLEFYKDDEEMLAALDRNQALPGAEHAGDNQMVLPTDPDALAELEERTGGEFFTPTETRKRISVIEAIPEDERTNEDRAMLLMLNRKLEGETGRGRTVNVDAMLNASAQTNAVKKANETGRAVPYLDANGVQHYQHPNTPEAIEQRDTAREARRSKRQEEDKREIEERRARQKGEKVDHSVREAQLSEDHAEFSEQLVELEAELEAAGDAATPQQQREARLLRQHIAGLESRLSVHTSTVAAPQTQRDLFEQTWTVAVEGMDAGTTTPLEVATQWEPSNYFDEEQLETAAGIRYVKRYNDLMKVMDGDSSPGIKRLALESFRDEMAKSMSDQPFQPTVEDHVKDYKLPDGVTSAPQDDGYIEVIQGQVERGDRTAEEGMELIREREADIMERNFAIPDEEEAAKPEDYAEAKTLESMANASVVELADTANVTTEQIMAVYDQFHADAQSFDGINEELVVTAFHNALAKKALPVADFMRELQRRQAGATLEGVRPNQQVPFPQDLPDDDDAAKGSVPNSQALEAQPITGAPAPVSASRSQAIDDMASDLPKPESEGDSPNESTISLYVTAAMAAVADDPSLGNAAEVTKSLLASNGWR